MKKDFVISNKMLFSAAQPRDMLAVVPLLSTVTSCMFALPVRAQFGSDCSDVAPCPENRVCSLGYCRCPQGYVKIKEDCLPERSFNESCSHDDQCADFRLKCSEGRCGCVKYYHWDEYSKQCLTLKDLKYMLSDMEEKFNSTGKLYAETNKVFTGLVWTGLAVMVIGLLLASACMFYGCCYGRLCCCRYEKLSQPAKSGCVSSDSACRYTQRTMESSVRGSTNNEGHHKSVSQGPGIDYIPALYDTATSFDVS